MATAKRGDKAKATATNTTKQKCILPQRGEYDYLQLDSANKWGGDLLTKFLITHNNYEAILAQSGRLAEHNITKIYLRDKNLPLPIFRAFLELKNVEIFVNFAESRAILAHKNIHLKSNELHLAKVLKSQNLDFSIGGLPRSHSLARNDKFCVDSANRVKTLDSAPQTKNAQSTPFSQNLHKILSYSAHSLEEILNAHSAKIDYIFISPIFAVENKNPPLGIDFIKQIPREIKPKIFALGGINSDNISAFENLGIAGIAGIRIFDEVFS